MNGSVKITPLQWLSAKEVLGGEATDFTPWLADNLDILGSALGLADLRLEKTEVSVQGKSLDILATGIDQDDTEFPVVIENQYGETNHRHLGQLVTYLAQYGTGYAVWVTEDYHPAHSAAINFLNRTSPDDVNYFLAQVRFTHGADGSHQVYFELVEKPNVFTKPQGARKPSGGTDFNVDRRDYLQKVLELSTPPLVADGFKSVRMHSHGAYMYARFPLPWLDEWARLRASVTKDEAVIRLVVSEFDDRAHNAAALDVLRDRYEEHWQALIPGEIEHEWHASSPTSRSDSVLLRNVGVGYVGGDPSKAAEWIVQVATSWLNAMQEDPVADLSADSEKYLADDTPEPDI